MRFQAWSAIAVAIALAIVAGAASARAGGDLYRGGDVVDGHGLLGLVVAADSSITDVVLEGPKGTYLHSGRLGRGQHLLLFLVIPGNYCLKRARVDGMNIALSEYGQTVCMNAVANAVGYAGHYGFRPDTSQPVIRYDEPDAFAQTLDKLYPALSGRLRIVDLLQVESARLRNEVNAYVSFAVIS